MTLRRWACVTLLALAGCALPLAPLAPPTPGLPLAPHLRLIGVAEISPGTQYGGTTLGGLSGIDYDPERDDYLLISDARQPHAYTARLHYDDAHGLAAPEFTGVHALLHASGQPFAPWWSPQAGMDRPDAEAVRWLPGARAFLWTSEGDFRRGFGPQLREARADGSHLRNLPLPAGFTPADEHGPRRNGTLEGLTLSPDGRSAWLAMELPWHQDGDEATPPSGGAPVRITQIDIASGRPLRQVAYQPDAVPHMRRLPGPQINGVSEILADGPHHLLVLERSYSAGAGFGARLYRMDTRAGSDTLALPALAPGNHSVAPKTLVADLAALGIRPDNVEGMTWGAPLQGGARGSGCVLVFVSDDNFNPAQVTQFIAAEYLPLRGGHERCGTNSAPS